jgi:hypothetical protein
MASSKPACEHTKAAVAVDADVDDVKTINDPAAGAEASTGAQSDGKSANSEASNNTRACTDQELQAILDGPKIPIDIDMSKIMQTVPTTALWQSTARLAQMEKAYMTLNAELKELKEKTADQRAEIQDLKKKNSEVECQFVKLSIDLENSAIKYKESITAYQNLATRFNKIAEFVKRCSFSPTTPQPPSS